MKIIHLPDESMPDHRMAAGGLSVYSYTASNQQDKLKINLTSHVLSFLTSGQKDVHFSDATVSATNQQALLIGSGNCLMTERLSHAGLYQSTLFFFTQSHVVDFLIKYVAAYPAGKAVTPNQTPYFVVEQDTFIRHFAQSLTVHNTLSDGILSKMLNLKFEEIMLYLVARDGDPFLTALRQLAASAGEVSFRAVIEANVFSKLSLEEISFLCNMSLSTFKRHFISIYHETPGKWFQHRRLMRAKELLQLGEVKASDIFLEFGYESLSNFSAAFKQAFGFSPRQALAS